MLDLYEQLKQAVADAEDDVRKTAGGNRAAGTRVRKQMQEVKKIAQDLRKAVIDARDGDEPSA